MKFAKFFLICVFDFEFTSNKGMSDRDGFIHIHAHSLLTWELNDGINKKHINVPEKKKKKQQQTNVSKIII